MTMKKFFLLLFLFAVTAILAPAQKTDAWTNYSSVEGRYKILFPSVPNVVRQDANTPDGGRVDQFLATVVEPGDVAYMVGYFDYPQGTTFSPDDARDGMIKNFNATLINEKDIKFSGYSARELNMVFKSQQGVSYLDTVRMFATEQRVFVLQFLYPKTLDSDALRTRGLKFMDSFEVQAKANP
jgi:hypothetical protein